jgi:V8-like Glu-specific endopeptidase
MRHLLLSLFFALPLSSPADGLRELRTADEIRGFEAVGRIDFGTATRGSYCTGTLVTPTLVLTAAHCLFDEAGNGVSADKITFRAGLRNGQADAERRVRRMVMHPDYDPLGPPNHENVAADVALLELDQALNGTRVRPMSGTSMLIPGKQVQVVSYAAGRSETPSLEEACNVLDRGARILVLDCDATFGASGAPVFVASEDGYKIVSIISAGGKLGDKDATYAVTVESGLSALMQEFARLPNIPTVRKIAHPGDRTGAGGTIRFIRPGG